MYGSYTVTNCGEHDTAEYKLRTLQISPLDNVSVPHPCRLSGPPCLVGRGMEPGAGAGGTDSMYRVQENLVRDIWHYQYLSWPDHGVPSEPGGVLSFLDQINQQQERLPHAGPIIVHCR